MRNQTLALDLGTNSIGWALVEFDENQEPQRLVDCGARIFQEAVDAKTEVPKNRARRMARGARRVHARRKQRKQLLLGILSGHGLLPTDAEQRQRILTAADSDPYLLRKRGLDERLELAEFGWALFHLCQRRGFLSNRKASGNQEKKKEEEGIKKEINELRRTMQEAQARTLGEYLAGVPKKRGLHTSRDMYEEEFEKLWAAQRQEHEDVLTDDLKIKIHRAIFFQRPPKGQKHLVGRCTFEPHLKRASRAWLEEQRRRLWQDINHLEVRDPAIRGYRKLRDQERRTLFQRLDEGDKESITWKAVRKLLGFTEDQTFNLEEGGKEKLLGNLTAARLRKAVPKTDERPKGWDSYSAEEQRRLLEDLLTIQDERALLKRLRNHWKLDPAPAEQVAKVELPSGYARLSLKAIKKLLPFLEQGKLYSEACQAAGYAVGDVRPHTDAEKLGMPPKLRNPVVQKALYEVRKVVNAILREYGKPTAIRVELARDMKLTKKQKERLEKRNRENRRLNDQADEKCRELGIIPSGDSRLRYRLWLESNMACPYTGAQISLQDLFSPQGIVDIEHILPYRQTWDDSYLNKTLCLAGENRAGKRDRSPHDAYSGEPEKYDAITQRVEHSRMPWPKRRKFYQQEIQTDEFLNRQLSDTRFISREVRTYLLQLGVPVEISKGEATAVLRRRWNLNSILDPSSNPEKNRADHRHHAVDAVVIALTSRALFQKLSRLSGQYEAALSEHAFHLDPPWTGFQTEIKNRIETVIVSHAPTRKITGALHEAFAYGEVKRDGKTYYVRRKSLNDLASQKKLGQQQMEKVCQKILDDAVRKQVRERLLQHDGDLKTAFGQPLYHVDGKTPIHKVRMAETFSEDTELLRVKDKTGREYKFYPLGSNHHVEIFEHPDTEKRKVIFVTTLEAARRARIEKNPARIVRRDGADGWQFVMSLFPNDMVETEENGANVYYRLQKMSSGRTDEITLRLHTAATLEDKEEEWRITSMKETAKLQKVSVDPIGRVSYCHD